MVLGHVQPSPPKNSRRVLSRPVFTTLRDRTFLSATTQYLHQANRICSSCLCKTLHTNHSPTSRFAASRMPGTMEDPLTDNVRYSRESFDNIYLDLSNLSGKCRFAETGFGWKPSGGGDTFTLDHSNIGSAQWSRAAKGYEVKILLRSSGIVQLDGFAQEVSHLENMFEGRSLQE